MLTISTARGYPHNADDLGDYIGYDLLPLVRRFLYEQINPDSELSGSQVNLSQCPNFQEYISVFTSAIATFYAPSDLSGSGGMLRQRIRATLAWTHGKVVAPRYDCVLVEGVADQPGFEGMLVARVRLFFSFQYLETTYPCALVDWFENADVAVDRDTGMWAVKPEVRGAQRVSSVIHLDCVLRGAHLLAIFGKKFVPLNIRYHQTLDLFPSFYVNKYIDHHLFETVF